MHIEQFYLMIMTYTRRLKSKTQDKPGPLLVELAHSNERNPIPLASKKLRNSNEHKSIYISPDLTEAEKQLDYSLRQERNKSKPAAWAGLALSIWKSIPSFKKSQ